MTDPKQAQELIDKDRTERVQRCNLEIEAILKKENCHLEPVIILTSKGNVAQTKIIAK